MRVVAGTSYECTWTTILPGGQIVVAGPFYDAKDSKLAITGGTGRYRDARGTMDLHARAGGIGSTPSCSTSTTEPSGHRGRSLSGALGTTARHSQPPLNSAAPAGVAQSVRAAES